MMRLCTSALAGVVLIPVPGTDGPAGPPPKQAIGVADYQDVTIVRVVGDDIRGRLDLAVFDLAVGAALDGRQEAYDFVMVVLTDGAPNQLGGGAFYSPMNTSDQSGTGNSWQKRDDRPVRGALFMNEVGGWKNAGDVGAWAFGQELGHHWGSFVRIDRGQGPENLLLGRQDAHWSWYMDTGSSPLEGNTWVDHGDGSFSTDTSQGPGGFCDLDLYLMGLIEAEDVAPFFVIEPAEGVTVSPEAPPDHLWGVSSTVIDGTRIDLSADHVIAAEGLVSPGPGEADTAHEVLTVLIAGDDEKIDRQTIDDLAQLQVEWTDSWKRDTRELSTVDFSIRDETHTAPASTGPALLPGGAR